MEIAATGREQIGQSSFDFVPTDGNHRDYPFVGHRAHPNDLQALCNYTQRFGYDAVGNLDSFNHRARGEGWTRHYDYEETSLIESNKTNNRLTRTRIGDGFNQIESYIHDAHGNMTSMPHLSAMTWDSEDRLHEVNLGGGGKAYYIYDAAGQRVRKIIESQNGTRRKERIYLSGFELYREYGSDGQTVSLERESIHVMDDQRRIVLVETQTVEDGNAINAPIPLQRYQLGNHLGSASLELDEFGDLISYEEYHPYGTTSFQAGRSAAEVSLKCYRYTAKERDEESGLNYHGARYYAPWLARWTSADPAGMVDGTNLFGYCGNNPVCRFDSTGLLGENAPIQLHDPNNPYDYDSPEAFCEGIKGDKTGCREEWKQVHASLGEEEVQSDSIDQVEPTETPPVRDTLADWDRFYANYQNQLAEELQPDTSTTKIVALAIATLGVELMNGAIDTARLGEGVKQGGAKGYAQDALRVLGLGLTFLGLGLAGIGYDFSLPRTRVRWSPERPFDSNRLARPSKLCARPCSSRECAS